MLVAHPPPQGPFFGTQQLMVWDFQLLSSVHSVPAGHPRAVQDLAGYFLSLAFLQHFPMVSGSRSLLDAGKAWRRKKGEILINDRGM